MGIAEYGKAEEMECASCVETLVGELRAFQPTLADDEELMVCVGGVTLRLEEIRHEHNAVVLKGTVPKGTARVTAVCHYRQLDVLFFAGRKLSADKPAVRIGF